jgi:hypothetical protein
MAHLFVGTLAFSGKWRGVLAPEMTQHGSSMGSTGSAGAWVG